MRKSLFYTSESTFSCRYNALPVYPKSPFHGVIVHISCAGTSQTVVRNGFYRFPALSFAISYCQNILLPYVYIYAGDLKYVENDNELAGVVAHEIGHLVNGHYSKSSILNNIISAFKPDTKTETASTTVNLIKTVSSNRVNKENEKEADITAVDLMMNAKYNPLALISVVYKSDIAENGGILSEDLSCEERIMNIYDYANYNYPAQVKANYKTDSYQSALNLIYANLKIRNADSKKLAKAKKEQEKLQKDKLKRMRNMAKSTNPWSAAYSMLEASQSY